jgi:hypothetical protein
LRARFCGFGMVCGVAQTYNCACVCVYSTVRVSVKSRSSCQFQVNSNPHPSNCFARTRHARASLRTHTHSHSSLFPSPLYTRATNATPQHRLFLRKCSNSRTVQRATPAHRSSVSSCSHSTHALTHTYPSQILTRFAHAAHAPHFAPPHRTLYTKHQQNQAPLHVPCATSTRAPHLNPVTRASTRHSQSNEPKKPRIHRSS